MIKKPQLFSILFVVVIAALFVAGASQQTVVMSKASHATDLWNMSGHADVTSEAFIHWDEGDPRVVSTSCARCHSTEGFQQWAQNGAVSTAPDLVALEAAGKKNSIRCEACHTSENGGTLRQFTSVTLPGAQPIAVEENGVICMQCHQGRESKASVDSRIAGVPGITDDQPSSSLSFRNVHYAPAAAVQFGTFGKVGYEYDGKSYDGRFSHIHGYNDCVTCHEPHSTKVREHNCDTCHDFNHLEDIRFFGSFLTDYDGDGDVNEGIYYELQTMQDKVYAAFLAYTRDIVGKPAVYGASHPYFFNDTNGNGIADTAEQSSSNSYKSFTPRSLRASFNIQFAKKDHAAFAHGGKYMIELLYDTLEDLNSALGAGAVSMAGMHRGDEGHFDGSAEAWRHWDGDGEVRSSCSRCHSATGLAEFIETGSNTNAQPLSNGMLCTTCHTSPPSLRQIASVPFPSGVSLSLGDNSNLCISCHQGRASKSSVDSKIAGGAGPYSFTNIHYFPVGAILFGTEAKGGYEYDGKTYAGRKMFANHLGRFDTCVECHMNSIGVLNADIRNHNVMKPDPKECILCHGYDPAQPNPGTDPALFKFSGIRPGSTPDYDGDGNMRESVHDEIMTLENALYAQIQAYGVAINDPLVYNSEHHPYWFKDENGNGVADEDETSSYSFDAKLLKAAYNYQASHKEPHGFIHNSLYVAQLLVDSIADLGGDVSAYTWR